MECHRGFLVKDVHPKSSKNSAAGQPGENFDWWAIEGLGRSFEDRDFTTSFRSDLAMTKGDGRFDAMIGFIWCTRLAVLAVCFLFNESIYMIFLAATGFLFSVCFCLLPGFSQHFVWMFGRTQASCPVDTFRWLHVPRGRLGLGQGGVTAAAGCCCGVVVAGAMFPFIGNNTCTRWSTWSLQCVPILSQFLVHTAIAWTAPGEAIASSSWCQGRQWRWRQFMVVVEVLFSEWFFSPLRMRMLVKKDYEAFLGDHGARTKSSVLHCYWEGGWS